ncbi:hypothetical protein BS17DRAFT_660365, partial [Gyrodon lividus]
HRRLSHTNYHTVYDLACSGAVSGMSVDLSSKPFVCDGCILSKQTRMPVLKVRRGKWVEQHLEKVHVDLMEHPNVTLASGHRYIMHIIND